MASSMPWETDSLRRQAATGPLARLRRDVASLSDAISSDNVDRRLNICLSSIEKGVNELREVQWATVEQLRERLGL